MKFHVKLTFNLLQFGYLKSVKRRQIRGISWRDKKSEFREFKTQLVCLQATKGLREILIIALDTDLRS